MAGGGHVARRLVMLHLVHRAMAFRPFGSGTSRRLRCRVGGSSAWGGELSVEVARSAEVMQCCVRLCLDIQESMAVARGEEATLGTGVSSSNAGASMSVKDDNTPVTAADFAIQGFVSLALKEAFPEDSFMGEEDATDLRNDAALLAKSLEMARSLAGEYGGEEAAALVDERTFLEAVDRGVEERVGGRRVWILDPIDGTKGLVTGQQYAIGLALVSDSGDPVLGLMGNPAQGPLTIMVGCKGAGIRYWPYAGMGYMENARKPDWQGVNYDYSRLAPDAKGSWGSVGSTAKMQGVDYPPYLLSRPMTTGSPMPFGPSAPPAQLCCGALVKYWAVAAGDVAGFIQFENTLKAWDHAAGIACVNESGGTCLDASGNPVVVSDRTFSVDRAVVCCAKAADQKTKQLLQASVLESS